MFFAVLICHLIFSVGFSSMSLTEPCWKSKKSLFSNISEDSFTLVGRAIAHLKKITDLKNLKNFHYRLSKRETEGSNRELIDSSNQTSSLENKTEKSYLEEYLRLKHRYLLKNHIDDFETHFGLHFTPNWTIVDHYSSPARQCVEIRRQKWEYMLENFNGSYAIARLNSELQNTAINRTTFCKHIAEIYSVLSDNRYVFDDDASCGQNLEGLKFVRNPLHEMSAKTFMSSISNSKGRSEDEEVIQLPKSLYIDLIRKDAHAAVVKQHHKDEMKHLKNEYRNKIRQAREPLNWLKEI